MGASRWIVMISFLMVLAAPLVVRQVAPSTGSAPKPPPAGERQSLIIVTPHIEQIREEFSAGFADWHVRRFPGEPPVYIDWRVPGGTTEILRLLQAVYQAQLKRELGRLAAHDPARLADPGLAATDLVPTGTIDFDVMFGGGSYDHTRLKDTRNVSAWIRPFPGGAAEICTLSAPSEGLDRNRLASMKDITGTVTLESGAALRLRVPLTAIREVVSGGAGSESPRDSAAAAAERVLAPFLAGEKTMRCVIDLSSVERELAVPMSIPAGFSPAQLDEWFGENRVGAGQLYEDNRSKSGRDDDWQYWLGAALSGFGIVYNRELVAEAGLPEPVFFEDLCDFRYFRRVALADPRQSGSVATLYDSILNESANAEIVKARGAIKDRALDPARPADKAVADQLLAEARQRGWDHGWGVLRELCANAHGYAASSTYPPMAVSQGEALAGVCIDFYGRGQAQAVLAPGQDDAAGRVGYIDPPGRVFIDADPVSILRGGPNPTLARRFVEFCMSREGQALWQFPARETRAGRSNPPIPGVEPPKRLGPKVNALRRMPARRDMYEPEWFEHFIDRADPFKAASTAPSQEWRDGMIVMMGCFGIEVSDELRAAWVALNRARADASFPPEVRSKMESLFYAMPTHAVRGRDGTTRNLVFSAATYKEISADVSRWRDPVKSPLARIAYTEFFRSNYAEVAELGRTAKASFAESH